MERKDQIFEAGQQYLDSMDEFQRYHTYVGSKEYVNCIKLLKKKYRESNAKIRKV